MNNNNNRDRQEWQYMMDTINLEKRLFLHQQHLDALIIQLNQFFDLHDDSGYRKQLFDKLQQELCNLQSIIETLNDEVCKLKFL